MIKNLVYKKDVKATPKAYFLENFGSEIPIVGKFYAFGRVIEVQPMCLPLKRKDKNGYLYFQVTYEDYTEDKNKTIFVYIKK